METILLTLAIFLVVRLAVQNFKVQGTSMLPTVKNGDLVLVNKVDYLVESPERGDVIVFRAPPQPQDDYIKRVIGVPGNIVAVNHGAVYVNGHRLRESYIAQAPNYVYPPHKVPKNDFFVLGDNRNDSYDSHVWGFVPRKNIIGKALIAYWPLLTDCHWSGLLPRCKTDLRFFSF